MTATPREPGEVPQDLKYVLLAIESRNTLYYEPGRAFKISDRGKPGIEYRASEHFVEGVERLAAAYRALLAQAPKVWTADTIQDAPEGEYLLRHCGEAYKWPYWGEKRCDRKTAENALAAHVIIAERSGKPNAIPKAFGPLPPPPEEKGG